MYYELTEARLRVARQAEITIEYKKIEIEGGFKIDLLVEDKIILELKSVLELHPVLQPNYLPT